MRRVEIKELIGFYLDEAHHYHDGDRKLRISRSGIRAVYDLCELYQWSRQGSEHCWAIRARPILRKLQNEHARSALNLVISKTPNPTILILAIWLRGRCGGSLGTPAIARFARHADLQLRKEVARALKRMGAWCELDQMAKVDASARIRQIASLRSSRPFRDRVQKFSTHVAYRPSDEHSSKHLFVAENVVLGKGRPARSRELLRVLLERIRSLIRGIEA